MRIYFHVIYTCITGKGYNFVIETAFSVQRLRTSLLLSFHWFDIFSLDFSQEGFFFMEKGIGVIFIFFTME